ncbi:MAG TPA: helix-turn-helix transcriptional regulator [Firmicutes bacterium]|nr:helix-turn-helix transcriptional regulator [Bacillota bacterium]
MAWLTAWNGRTKSILAFSFLSAYILSFLFEGQVLHRLLDFHQGDASGYIILAIGAHFLGLFTCGLFTRSAKRAWSVMLGGMGVSLLAMFPFFFSPSFLWSVGLILGGYASGATLAAWGFFLKAFTPNEERLKTCADVLILSNLIMVTINVCTAYWSPFLGLVMIMLCLLVAMVVTWHLTFDEEGQGELGRGSRRSKGELRTALLLLCLFIAVLTINSGLMYEVMNPAFEHLTVLTSWYWAVPYMAALFVMRNLPRGVKHSRMLYIGMAMMVGAFIGFMILGRDAVDYLLMDTLMLAACGVFDLFWWSILAEMLDYTENPSLVFGIGLSANVLGVLSGGLIGMMAMSTQRINAEITVMALTVVCITLAILPLLNSRLVRLLTTHAYLEAYDTMGPSKQMAILYQTEALDPLTVREQEVLGEILAGKSNREIAAALYITENTVKTHARNIYSKYAVHSRAELISTLLKNEDL